MLTLKQSPVAIIGMLTACMLAEGEPSRGKAITAFCIVAITVLYVLMCNKLNSRKHE